jgi:hypothetical protein
MAALVIAGVLSTDKTRGNLSVSIDHILRSPVVSPKGSDSSRRQCSKYNGKILSSNEKALNGSALNLLSASFAYCDCLVLSGISTDGMLDLSRSANFRSLPRKTERRM